MPFVWRDRTGGAERGNRASFEREGRANRGWQRGARVVGARDCPARHAMFLRGMGVSAQ